MPLIPTLLKSLLYYGNYFYLIWVLENFKLICSLNYISIGQTELIYSTAKIFFLIIIVMMEFHPSHCLRQFLVTSGE